MNVYLSTAAVQAASSSETATRWEEVCNTREEFLWVGFSRFREPSRWTVAERKRAFEVVRHFPYGKASGGRQTVSSHAALEAAMRAARQWAADVMKTRAANTAQEAARWPRAPPTAAAPSPRTGPASTAPARA